MYILVFYYDFTTFDKYWFISPKQRSIWPMTNDETTLRLAQVTRTARLKHAVNDSPFFFPFGIFFRQHFKTNEPSESFPKKSSIYDKNFLDLN